MTLDQFFKAHQKVALAFSGGTDSSYLLYAGWKAGCEIKPYFIKTSFQPMFELEDANILCRQLGVTLNVLEYDVLTCEEVVENTADRCYRCKNRLFTMLIAAAKKDGCELVIDGTNASDNMADRPGMRALMELGVYSPLRECGITKEQVRRLSQEAGLFTAAKPSYACLATRIPTGTRIDGETLARVEKAEGLLMGMGFSDLRVRVAFDMARIQLKKEQLDKAVVLQGEIVTALSPLFKDIVLDLIPRRGD